MDVAERDEKFEREVTEDSSASLSSSLRSQTVRESSGEPWTDYTSATTQNRARNDEQHAATSASSLDIERVGPTAIGGFKMMHPGSQRTSRSSNTYRPDRYQNYTQSRGIQHPYNENAGNHVPYNRRLAPTRVPGQIGPTIIGGSDPVFQNGTIASLSWDTTHTTQQYYEPPTRPIYTSRTAIELERPLALQEVFTPLTLRPGYGEQHNQISMQQPDYTYPFEDGYQGAADDHFSLSVSESQWTTTQSSSGKLNSLVNTSTPPWHLAEGEYSNQDSLCPPSIEGSESVDQWDVTPEDNNSLVESCEDSRSPTLPPSQLQPSLHMDLTHICSSCKKSFKRAADLHKHEKIHLSPEDRKHPCDICELKFLYPKDLERHKATTHPDDDSPSYFCSVEDCWRAEGGTPFRRKDKLQEHIRDSHPTHISSPSPRSSYSSPPDIRACRQCSAIFKGDYGKGNLARHIKTQHGGSNFAPREFPCLLDNCVKTFKRSDARLKHLRKHHPRR